MPKLYDVVAIMPGGDPYFFNQPAPKPICYWILIRARIRDFSRAVGVLLRTGYECYPIVFRLVEVSESMV